ncbi:MAG TPA: methyltransferase domain-containing protein [Gaiellaceae bacterium]|nr:methyltransferase domain-containing protein [Gaiellaceae bacterium]
MAAQTGRPDHKAAAVEQWTADPCGSSIAEGEPGSRTYFENLVRGRFEYGPWMPDALGYDETSGLRVLDVGCGQGIDVYRYALAGADATGVDLTPRHVKLARLHLEEMGLEAEIVQGDAEQLPFADASFDRVSSNGVLHHTPDMPAALREIRRVLVPGGEARVIVYNRNSFHYWLAQVLQQGVLRGGLLREHSMAGVLSSGVEHSSIGARPLVRVYTPRQLRELLTEAGLVGVTTSVRHFQPTDTPVTSVLRRFVRKLDDPRVLERIGRIGGWYVVGTGTRPAEQP